jgi:hypothetical protein
MFATTNGSKTNFGLFLLHLSVSLLAFCPLCKLIFTPGNLANDRYWGICGTVKGSICYQQNYGTGFTFGQGQEKTRTGDRLITPACKTASWVADSRNLNGGRTTVTLLAVLGSLSTWTGGGSSLRDILDFSQGTTESELVSSEPGVTGSFGTSVTSSVIRCLSSHVEFHSLCLGLRLSF